MAQVLTKTGVVKAVQGRMALVLTRMEPECESCTAKNACFGLGGGGVNKEIRARNTAKAEVGDVVTVSMRSSSLLKISFLIYMVPILALIGGILFGYFLSNLIAFDQNVLVGLFGGLFLASAFLWVKKKGNRLSDRKEFVPEIISRKSPQEAITPSDLTCPVK